MPGIVLQCSPNGANDQRVRYSHGTGKFQACLHLAFAVFVGNNICNMLNVGAGDHQEINCRVSIRVPLDQLIDDRVELRLAQRRDNRGLGAVVDLAGADAGVRQLRVV